MEKLKEPRVYLSVAAIIMIFLPWLATNTSAEGYGASASASMGTSGIQLFRYAFMGYLLFLIPIAFLVIEFVSTIVINSGLVYMIGSAASIIVSVVTVFWAKKTMSSAGDAASGIAAAAGVDSDTKVSFGYGFILLIVIYIAIIVVTAIKDFALSKDAIAEKGLKGALTDVANQVANETTQTVDNIKADGLTNGLTAGTTCPSCGATIAAGKNFCPKCGIRIEIPAGSPSAAPAPAAAPAAAQPKAKPAAKKAQAAMPTEGMTVADYIRTLPDITCEKCGKHLVPGMKFCPECGVKVVVKISPEKCSSCGERLITGKEFCSNCGERVELIELKTNCAKCGGDLIFGKKFCVECGAKVE